MATSFNKFLYPKGCFSFCPLSRIWKYQPARTWLSCDLVPIRDHTHHTLPAAQFLSRRCSQLSDLPSHGCSRHCLGCFCSTLNLCLQSLCMAMPSSWKVSPSEGHKAAREAWLPWGTGGAPRRHPQPLLVSPVQAVPPSPPL